MSDASSRYDQLDRSLRFVFLEIKKDMDPSIAVEVEEYLDNNEYGLALEGLAAGVAKSPRKIDAHLIKYILHRALDMDIFDDQNINELHLKLTRERAIEVAKDNSRGRDSYTAHS